MTKGRIENNKYYDANGSEVREGDTLIMEHGDAKKVYLLDSGALGIDATNPAWIRSGRAWPCEFGCWELNEEDMKTAVKVEHERFFELMETAEKLGEHKDTDWAYEHEADYIKFEEVLEYLFNQELLTAREYNALGFVAFYDFDVKEED